MLVCEEIQRAGWDVLTALNIRINKHEDGRVLLNYNQIDSPKENPLVCECRALTLDESGGLIARSFSRFFNYGEAQNITKGFNWDSPITSYDKIDGSFIKVFYRDGWKIQTRASFGEDNMPSISCSWEYVVKECLKAGFFDSAPKHVTFVFELTSPFNQVVQIHTNTNLWLLTAFTGKNELSDDCVDFLAKDLSLLRPARHTFYDLKEVEKYIQDKCKEYVAFEGVVLKDNGGMRLKIKSSNYIALHRLNNNGNIYLDKHIIPLIMAGEIEEVAVYFPLVKEKAAEIQARIDVRMKEVDDYWYCFHDVDSRKKFAESVFGCRWKSLLFTAYTKGGHPRDYLTADFIERSL